MALGPNYIDRYVFATQTNFTSRVQFALMAEARLVGFEDAATPLHAQRIALAKSVQANAAQYTLAFSLLILADLGFDDNSTDAGLQAEVHTLWNLFLV